MSSKLSATAKHRISDFLNSQGRYVTDEIDREWRFVGELYFTPQRFAPTSDYLRSDEFDLSLRSDSLDVAIRLIFGGSRSAKFWQRIPDGLIPKIVEHFLALIDEPKPLDFTFVSQSDWTPGEFWPEVYASRFPCPKCSEVVNVADENYGGMSPEMPRRHGFWGYLWVPDEQSEPASKHPVTYTVEKFHMRNDHLTRQLTLEFHFTLEDPFFDGTRRVEDYENRPYKSKLRKIVARLAEPSCTPEMKLKAPAKSKRLLQISEVAKEVFAFNSRYHLEVCRLVCTEWKELVDRESHAFALHHLKCTFWHDESGLIHIQLDRDEQLRRPICWFDVTNFREDIPYNDERRFEFTEWTPPEYECALIRRHLRDCYVVDFECPYDRTDFEWSVRMLPALENCSIGRLRLDVESDHLGRVRPSIEAAFVKLNVRRWATSTKEGMLQELVEHHDLLHWPVLQQLTELEIKLHAWHEPKTDPFWTRALLLLPNCKKLTISYFKEGDADFRPVCQALVDVAEAFERDEISDLVDRFVFNPYRVLEFPFDYKNLAYDELRIRNTRLDREYIWDVYHFQNVRTKTWLTAFVGQSLSRQTVTTLHLKKGRFEPNGSFL
ncbi:hypothetical protein AAVH_25094 [Aphelenchoides avenae]|nr:hypothetical protein AAVH_25094 [Aphelenchus avenae]